MVMPLEGAVRALYPDSLRVLHPAPQLPLLLGELPRPLGSQECDAGGAALVSRNPEEYQKTQIQNQRLGQLLTFCEVG